MDGVKYILRYRSFYRTLVVDWLVRTLHQSQKNMNQDAGMKHGSDDYKSEYINTLRNSPSNVKLSTNWETSNKTLQKKLGWEGMDRTKANKWQIHFADISWFSKCSNNNNEKTTKSQNKQPTPTLLDLNYEHVYAFFVQARTGIHKYAHTPTLPKTYGKYLHTHNILFSQTKATLKKTNKKT